jgi:hypothetical protein
MTRKDIAIYIQRAQAAGSTATTLRGAGKWMLARVRPGHTFFRVSCMGPLARQRPVDVRNARLIRRYAGLRVFPRYLSPADRATITTSRAHRDVLAMRAIPVYARAYYITTAMQEIPRFAREIKAALASKGKLVESSIVARDAESRVNWGLLRVHETGDSVLPSRVGVRETGSNRDWTKCSTLRRYADYCLIAPAKHAGVWSMHYVTPRHERLTVYRTAHYSRIAGKPAVKLTPTAPPSLALPIHIRRRMLVTAAPPVLRVETDRAAKKLMLVDALGEQYHIPAIRTMADARSEVRQAIAAFRKRRAERIIDVTEQAQRIYVSLDDSYAAGNCRSMSDDFARQIWERIGAQGPAAVRADVILAARNDAYTRRACAFAAARMEVA